VYHSYACGSIISNPYSKFELCSVGLTQETTCSPDGVPISVCMDGEYGYAIFRDNYIRKFNLVSGETIHSWAVPMNAPIHHQIAVISGRIYYCNVNNNEIIIFPTSEESALKVSVMSLGDVEKPAFIADNTKHHKETIIVGGAAGLGKYPIRHGFCEPKWFTRVEHARGICVDDRGLIYVARHNVPEITFHSQKTGS